MPTLSVTFATPVGSYPRHQHQCVCRDPPVAIKTSPQRKGFNQMASSPIQISDPVNLKNLIDNDATLQDGQRTSLQRTRTTCVHPVPRCGRYCYQRVHRQAVKKRLPQPKTCGGAVAAGDGNCICWRTHCTYLPNVAVIAVTDRCDCRFALVALLFAAVCSHAACPD